MGLEPTTPKREYGLAGRCLNQFGATLRIMEVGSRKLEVGSTSQSFILIIEVGNGKQEITSSHSIEIFCAGGGNRTPDISLARIHFTTKLHPLKCGDGGNRTHV